jgi:hypothetical protein
MAGQTIFARRTGEIVINVYGKRRGSVRLIGLNTAPARGHPIERNREEFDAI